MSEINCMKCDTALYSVVDAVPDEHDGSMAAFDSMNYISNIIHKSGVHKMLAYPVPVSDIYLHSNDDCSNYVKTHAAGYVFSEHF